MAPRLSIALTAGLGLLLMASLVVQSRFTLASFQNGDAVVATFRQLADKRALIAASDRALQTLPPRGTDDPAAMAAALHVLGAMGREGAEVAAVLRDEGVGTLERWRNRLEAELARTMADILSKTGERSSDHRAIYVMVLVTGYIALLVAVAGCFAAALYANEHAESRQRVDRARRTVLEAEQKRAGFLAAAAHDLRQPMQAMRLFVDAIVCGELDPATRDKAGKIGMAAEAMERMINSLIDVAKLDAGLIDADKRDMALRQLTGSFRVEFEQLAAAAGLRFRMQLPDAAVYTDPDLLERILRNLVGNAIRYTRTGEVEVRAAEAGGIVIVEVRDTGIGIPADRLGAIFEDFTRVSGSQSDGLGLGLGIVRRLADLLTVSVSVESTLGTGSVFRVAIPAAPGRPRTRPIAADARAA